MEESLQALRRLSSREREIVGLIAQGCTNGEIADRLGISFSTAKWHVSEIISKLGVDSREDVAAWWKQERSLRGRLGRVRAAAISSLSLKPLAGLLAGAAVVAGGAFAAFALAASDGNRPGDQPSMPAATGSTSTATAKPNQIPLEYTVQVGDTCGSIAARLGFPEALLRARNPAIDSRCTNLQLGQVLRLGIPGAATPDAPRLIHLADLDGIRSQGYITGVVDPKDGLVIYQHQDGGAPDTGHNISLFAGWELFIAAAGTSDGSGGVIAVGGTDRVARIDLVVDGGPPTSFTPGSAPPALGAALRFIYITVPPGRVWEFWAYDDAGTYLGTVAHGSSIGAGESYIPRTSPGAPTPTPPDPRPDWVDANSNGHVLSISPAEGAQVSQADMAVWTGVCAVVTEAGRGPAVRLADFELWVDHLDITTSATFLTDGDRQTATSGTLCYAPAGGLAPGRHNASIMVRNGAGGGYLGVVHWQFEVLPDR